MRTPDINKIYLSRWQMKTPDECRKYLWRRAALGRVLTQEERLGMLTVVAQHCDMMSARIDQLVKGGLR